MPTVIDSLIVELGLDPKGFDEGRKKAAYDLVKTKDEATRTAKEMEARGKQAGEFFGRIRGQAVALFTTLAGGRALEQFVKDTLKSDAATGRLAKTIGETTGELGAWQRVAERSGGTAQGITSALGSLSDQFQQIQLTGTSASAPYLQALGLKREDLNDTSESLLKISDALSKMDPRRARAFGQALGFDQETINLLIRGRPAVEAMLAAEKKRGGVSDESAKASAELNAQLADLKHEMDEAGRSILVNFAPGATAFLKWLNELLTLHPRALSAIWGLTAALTALSAVKVGAGLLGVLGRIGGGAAATAVAETAAGGATVGAVAKQALGVAARVNPVVAGVALALTPTEANKGEKEALAPLRERQIAMINASTARRQGVAATARDMIQKHEGFASKAYWDVNAYRVGYGSDTITDPKTGKVSRVTKDTAGVSKEAAGADLERRLRDEFMPKAAAAAGEAWEKYNATTKAALTSVAYNYGSIPKRIRSAVQSGDATKVAAAIRTLEHDNKTAKHPEGVNFNRRNAEANDVLASVGVKSGVQVGAERPGGAPQTVNNTTTIGQIHVVTQATDAKGLAKDLKPALSNVAAQANSGIQ